jgi:hypothetical protein
VLGVSLATAERPVQQKNSHAGAKHRVPIRIAKNP